MLLFIKKISINVCLTKGSEPDVADTEICQKRLMNKKQNVTRFDYN